MRLGIVVTDIAYLTAVTRLIDAIRARDWQAECFLTDTGVMLLADTGFVTRAKAVRNSVAVCEHSAERYAGDPAAHARQIGILFSLGRGLHLLRDAYRKYVFLLRSLRARRRGAEQD